MSQVKLVAISTPLLESSDIISAEQFIAYAARVSNPSNQSNPNTASLIKYLIKNNHWSPFEMVSMTMEIKTTRDIARQILRHRSFSFQEFSQRYAEVTDFELKDARLQDSKNRQNSIEVGDILLKENWYTIQEEVIDFCNTRYKRALDYGIAKEQARAVLPEGLTQSTLYMAGTLRSWIHYCQLRMSNGTQKEHREIAIECWSELGYDFPNVVVAYEEIKSGT